MYPSVARDAYWPDMYLRSQIPGRWLAEQGVRVFFAPFSTPEDIRAIIAAAAGCRIAFRVGWAIPCVLEALNGQPFTLLPEMPNQHMHLVDGGPMPPERQSGQALLLAAAEAVIVYSQPVADAFTTGFELGGPIHVVPDALATLPPAPADPDRSRLVWGALSYPQRSLAVMGTAVERLLGARPSVRLAVFWGATLWLQTWWGSERHPRIDQVSPNGLLPYLRYLDVLLGLRPGIVLHPMADQPGNELRGMSTALNAALAGAALIVSPRGLYPSHFRDGEECLFAADDDWETAIARVLDDPPLRDHLAAGLRRWVQHHALIEHTGPRWAKALGLEISGGLLQELGRAAPGAGGEDIP